MHISGIEPSLVILSERFLLILTQKSFMLSKLYKSTKANRRTWLHVPYGTPWSTSSDTRQVVEIIVEPSTKMYTSFLIGFN